jgi:hypothetical protein
MMWQATVRQEQVLSGSRRLDGDASEDDDMDVLGFMMEWLGWTWTEIPLHT